MGEKGATVTLSDGRTFRVYVGNRARTAAGIGISAISEEEANLPVSELSTSKQIEIADTIFRATIAATMPRVGEADLDEMPDADYAILAAEVSKQLGATTEAADPLSEAPVESSS